MTARKKFKQLVRERMAVTGENYTAAKLQVESAYFGKPEFPCERCGYTERDQQIHGDHHLCKLASAEGRT